MPQLWKRPGFGRGVFIGKSRPYSFAILDKVMAYLVAKKLGWMLLVLGPSYVFADPAADEYRTLLAPTLAVFYTVDSEGRSTRESPVVAVITSPASDSPRNVARPRSGIQRNMRRDRKRAKTVPVRVRRSGYDRFEAYRCERHGFYYTRNGRCVRPALPTGRFFKASSRPVSQNLQ